MRTLALLALLLAARGAAFAGVLGAPEGLRDARAARAMLGNGIWARVVRIDNTGPRPAWRRSLYPRIVYALVFELSGILWFYTDRDGTQSLSLTLGTADRDKAAPGPLFRAIDPGFASWSWVGDAAAGPAAEPPNACFVESVAALLQRMAVEGRRRRRRFSPTTWTPRPAAWAIRSSSSARTAGWRRSIREPGRGRS